MAELQARLATLQAEQDALILKPETSKVWGPSLDRWTLKCPHSLIELDTPESQVEPSDLRIHESENRSSDDGRVRRLEYERTEMVSTDSAGLREVARAERRAVEPMITLRNQVELERLRAEFEYGMYASEAEQVKNNGELVAEQEAHAAPVTQHQQFVFRH
ncbi:hypothetical protein FRC12_003354 [Ceratobasidium sp. 428]|nr:hypothetical protein FRC12_003354 [Ceratobasidium sp. 428]